MMRLGIAIFGISFLCIAPAQADFVARVLKCDGDPCVVRNSPGGWVADFEHAAHAIRNGARSRIIINGKCESACVLLADIARAKVCTTSRARFGFHKYGEAVGIRNGKFIVGKHTLYDPPHSRDIDRIVRANGGYPRKGMKTLSRSKFAHIWRKCSA